MKFIFVANSDLKIVEFIFVDIFQLNNNMNLSVV